MSLNSESASVSTRKSSSGTSGMGESDATFFSY